jgi:purine-cytosine permease-like protein
VVLAVMAAAGQVFGQQQPYRVLQIKAVVVVVVVAVVGQQVGRVVQAWLFCLFLQTVIQALTQAHQSSQRQDQTRSYSSTLLVLTRRKSWLSKSKT